jgi:AbrB family transcriptional regulator (stage V sporulation protein T)
MKATGIVRRIDDLGRVVIPKEIRRTMRIREGDPLEIFTDKEGGVVFRKYSLMEGLSDFAGILCDSLNRSTGRVTVITDRDSCIAVSGAPRRELLEKAVSPELEELMEERKIYQFRPGSPVVPLFSGGEGGFAVDTAAPILSEGDVLGCVIFLAGAGQQPSGEVEYKLAQSISAFLGKHMEF